MVWFINEMTEQLIKQMEKCNRWSTVDIFLFIFHIYLNCVWKTHFQKSDYTISNFKSFNQLCCWSAMITEGAKKKKKKQLWLKAFCLPQHPATFVPLHICQEWCPIAQCQAGKSAPCHFRNDNLSLSQVCSQFGPQSHSLPRKKGGFVGEC